MRTQSNELVWYACYGSNIDITRFSKYLEGGELKTTGEKTKIYKCCKLDSAPPRQSKPFSLPYKLVFGKTSHTWDGHGVAFIGNKKDKRTKTFSRIYLISKIQFAHLFAGENGRETVKIDYNSLDQFGKLDFDFNFYDRLLVVGAIDKYPVYTFTNSKQINFNRPCKEYLSYIFNGIKNIHKGKANDLVDRFSKLKTGFRKKDLKKIAEL